MGEQAPIKVFGVEGRYAHALFSAAAKTGELESAEQELNAVQALLNDEAALSEYESLQLFRPHSKLHERCCRGEQTSSKFRNHQGVQHYYACQKRRGRLQDHQCETPGLCSPRTAPINSAEVCETH